MKRRLGLVLFCAMSLSLAFQSVAAQKTGGAQSQASPVGNDLCLSCHGDVGGKLQHSVHSSVACQTCHVKHEDYPHPADVPKPACGSCHANIANDYKHGVHGQAAANGNSGAPECITCHGSAHEAQSPRTAQFRSGIPDICGACHADVAADYWGSVHGKAVKNGIVEAPVCTDCHGEHSILPPTDQASSVNPTHVRDTCARCHGDVRLTRRFGLPSDRIVSFDASYHGLAAKSGAETVANCASCHGVHNILPSSDPKSTINPKNLATTCGHCHVGAGTRFTLGPIHVVEGQTAPAPVRWVRNIYLLIIPLTIGFMFLHNFGDWLKKLRRLRFSSLPAGLPSQESQLRTFPFERINHAVMAISFIMLAWSGFALKFPDQWWARPLLLWEAARSTRGLIHRGASVVFMSAALAHILSLVVSRRLREHWKALRFNLHDAKEAFDNFLYNLGLRRANPGRSSHSYIEKSEYWALVWGSVVMISTGVLLWGNTFMLKWLPKIVLDVATSIHFYEAILATLAILVWHFYFVIFDPDVYPMDSAWFTGRSPRREPGPQLPAQEIRPHDESSS